MLRRCGIWVLIAVGLLPFEWAACDAAYETLGETLQGLCTLVLLAGMALIALSIPLGRPRITAAIVVLLALGSIPPQIWLSIRLHRLKTEAESIAAFVERVRALSGEYPPDLDGYSFRRPSLASHISYYGGQNPAGYSIHIWVIQPGISHDYSPARGWHYYPD